MTSTATKGLTKTQINRFKRMLDAKALEIRANLQSSSAAKALARGDEPPDLEELPGQSHEEWIFLNRNNIEALLLREIDEALDRIEDGGYGTCLECEELISFKRLEAVCWASRCVTCQEELSANDEPPERARSYRS
jgi:DnaK suppressor protein